MRLLYLESNNLIRGAVPFTIHKLPITISNMTIDDLLDAWRVNNAINLEFLDVCTDEDLELKPGKGKTIRSNFVHLIAVRRMWCDEKLKAEAETIPKLDWKTATR